MANWCRHWVEFSGEKDAVEKVLDVFYAMQEKQKTENVGHKPDFIKEVSQDWFFDIEVDYDENDGHVVVYNTKWSPNLEDLEAIAVHCGVNFSVDYEELGENIFGKAILTDAGIVRYDLEDEDFDLYSYSEEDDIYTYNGEFIDCEADILEKLFEERFGFSY